MRLFLIYIFIYKCYTHFSRIGGIKMLYIIIIILVILLICASITYNSLVKLYNRVKEAFSTMDVYLKKRWDLIPNIVETVKGYSNVQGTRKEYIIDRMLFAAMIEARSCERFRVLTENIKDEELKTFYKDLMISEAGHYTTFIGFARQLGDVEKVNARWEEWLDYEAEIIKSYGKKETIHG